MQNIINPVPHCQIVTPSDTLKLTNSAGQNIVTSAIRLAAAGAVTFTTVGGEKVTYASGMLAPGVAHPIQIVQIWNAGTDANTIAAEWYTAQ